MNSILSHKIKKNKLPSTIVIGKQFFRVYELIKNILLFIFLSIFLRIDVTSQTITFIYTGSIQYWNVPPNVCKIKIIARGAGGGGGGYDTQNMPGFGGHGARVEGEFSVNPGDVLSVYVGQGGQGGKGKVTGTGGGLGGWGYGIGGNGGNAGNNNPNNTTYYFSGGGGGGGGGSAVRNITTNQLLIVAGGGGGGGGNGWLGPDGSGDGGDGSQLGSNGSVGGSGSSGGIGGGNTNNNGTNGGNHVGDGGGGGGGGGGYLGGTGGSPSTGDATNNTLNKDENGGGGGGGSSYCNGASCTYFSGGGALGGGCCNNIDGYNGANGSVEIIIIGYRPTINLISASNTSNQSVCVNTPITNIVYSSNYGTGATFSGLPPGVNGTYNTTNGNVTISGTPTSSGTYTYTVTVSNQHCQNTITGTITVNPNKTITLTSGLGTNNQSICLNSSINTISYSITNSNNASITGLPPGVTGGYSGGTITISGIPTTTGTFNYTVTPVGCGNATATGTITVNPLPQVILSYNTSVCESSPLTINASSDLSNVSYNWIGPNLYSSNNQNVNIASAQLSQSGTYTVTVIENNTSCSASSMANVTVNPLPIISVSNNSPVCEDNTVNLSATVSNVGISQYLWIYPDNTTLLGPSLTITNAQPSHTGNYSVQVTSIHNCVASTQTSVVVNPNPVINPSSNSPVCEGLTLNFNANGTGSGITYNWTGPMSYNSSGNTTSINNVQISYSGIYVVTATNTSTLCTSTGSVDVVINPVPVLNPISNSPVCENGTLQLSANTIPNGNYTWNGPNISGMNQQNFNINPVSLADGGTYTVSVIDMNGCFASATTTVIINALPTIQALSNSPVCEEGSLNLFALTNAYNPSFLWIGPHSYSNYSQNITINPVSTLYNSLFTVIVTDGSTACTNSTSINAIINPLPQSTITTPNEQLTKCEKESITLSVFLDSIASSYQWVGPGGMTYNNNNWTINNLNANQSGLYTVTVTSNQGCTRSSTVDLTVYHKPLALFVVDQAAGCSEHCMNFNDLSTVSGSASITAWDWRNEGLNFSNIKDPNLCITNNGNTSKKYDIQLIVTSSDGCKDTLLMNDMIEVFPRPVTNYVSEKFDYTILDNILFLDQSIGNMNVINWNWDMGDGNFYTQPNITHSYSDTGSYSVTLTTTNNYGCTSSVSYIYYINETFTFYIPNSFTPNRDMINDIWKIKGRGIKEFKMEVYNRWGERIYETDDYTLGWPGTYKSTNEKVQAGTYTYKIYVFDTNNKEHNYIGHVNVIY